MRSRVLGLLLLGALLTLPATAQLQHFGYHASAEDDASVNKVKGYTNFSYISTSENIYDTRVPARVNAMNQAGMKAVIELGKVLWCDYDGSGFYRTLCWDWLQRWTNWKSFNAAILTPDKVLGLVVRDEPFNWDVSITDVDAVAGRIKSDLAVAHPTVKMWLLEAACVVAGEACGMNPGSGAFDRYQGTLANIDWIGLNAYFIHPETDPMYQTALARLKSRFPTKKRIYNMDAWWTTTHQEAFGAITAMGALAQEYHRVARSDAQAVALGVTSWLDLEGGLGSQSFPCSVLQEHVSIGRTITGKVRPQTSLPVGTFSIDTNGVASGWVCDPDATVCEMPRADLYVDGSFNATPALSTLDTQPQAQCGAGVGYRFRHTLARGTADRSVTLRVQDLSSGVSTVPSSCAQSPACVWTPHLRHFGYVGAGDDDLGLNQTRGYTDFSHIATVADVNSTFVRDRVTAMSQKGIKATIDLGKVLWCGTSYTYLCSDYVSRWNAWKQVNASILASDKVLAFAVRDQPFFNKVNISGYETAARLIKTDLPWSKIFLVEAACAVRGSCNGTSHTAFSQYTGTMPDVDWVGVAEYAIRPATNNSYKTAVQRIKAKFPGKKTVYIMDAYWDTSHDAVFSLSTMRTVAREWYNVARDDFDSILLGAFVWSPLSGATTSRSLGCDIMQEHVAVGREVTGKVRAQTGAPVGRLEGIYGGNVMGWACDPDGTVCENPRVDLYAGSSYYTTANFPNRNDYVLSPLCGAGLGIRFRSTLGNGSSGHSMTAVARDLDGTATATLPSNCLQNPACVWYSSYSDAKGYMEDLGATGIASGWVCDPDAPHLSTQVKLVANGTVIGTYTANLSNEPAVTAECGGGSNHRFSVQLPAWTRGYAVEAYSVDLTAGEFLLPWLCSDPWTDYWSCTW